MANNDVRVKVKVDSKGMGQLEKDTKKAKKGYDDLNKSYNSYQKREKGSAGITSNSTKAFSKMTTGIEGGLVPAYATLAANVFAVTAAFGVLQRAAAVEQLTKGMAMLGQDSGYAMLTLSKGLKAATKNSLSLEEAMRSTVMITSAGFDSSKVEEIGAAAQKAASALGRGTQESLERFTRGLVKMEAELLDELGLFPRVDTASKEYADSLGKSVTQLTQFEKRQAFANAALAEANEKFGSVDLDASPYDKLAASFADMTKEGLNFVNMFLKPAAGFLADFPGVLVGIFGVFASGIVSQITPSIKDSADAAKQASQQFAAKSAKAAKVVSKDYKMAAANVQKSWATVPKSVAKMETAFQNGTYTAKQLKDAIREVSKSEKMRSNAAISKNKEVAATRQLELAQIQNIKKALLDLEVQDKKRMVMSTSGAGAKSQSVGSGLTSRGLKEIDNAEGITKKFGAALKYSVLQVKNLARTPGVFNKITLSLKTAAGAAKLFGTALLQSIPIIGQIIMVATLLYEGFKYVKDAFTTKEQKALNSAVENSAEPMKEMITNLKAVDTRLASNSIHAMSTTKGYIAYSNALGTLTSQLTKFEETGAEGAFKEQAKLLQETINKTKTFRDAYEKAFGTTVIPVTKEGVAAAIEFAEKQELIAGRVKGVKEAFEAAATATTKFFNSMKETSAVSPILDAFTELDNSLIGKQIEEIQTVIDENVQKNPMLGGLILAVQEGGAELDNELKTQEAILQKTQAEIAKTKQGMLEFASYGNTGAEVAEIFGPTLTRLIQEEDALKTQVNELKKQKQDTDTVTPKSVKKAKEFFNLQNDTLINGKKQVKTLEAQLKEEKAKGSSSQASLEKQIELENKILEQKRKNNTTQADLLDALVKSGKLTKEEANMLATQGQLLAQNKALQEQKTLGLEQSLRLERLTLSNLQEEIKFENNLIDIAKRRASFKQTELALQEKIAIAAKKAENRGSVQRGYDPTLTAKDTKDIEESLLVKRIQNAVAENEIKKTQLDLEYALLEQRLVVAQIEAQLAADKLEEGDPRKDKLNNLAGLIGGQIDSFATLKAGAETQLQQAFGNQILNIVQGYQDKMDSSLKEALDGTQSGSTLDRMQSIRGMDMDTLPISQQVTAMEGIMGPTLEGLAQLGPEGELASAAAQGAFTVAGAWSTVGEVFNSNVTSMEKGAAVAQAVGQTFQQIGSIMAAQSKAQISAIDSEIDAEKKRDGKSKESLAKIQALENKKEQHKRKAFEKNKKVMMATTVANTAAAMMTALAPPPAGLGPVFGPALAAVAGVMGAAQLGIIASTSYDGGGSSSIGSAPTKVSVGNRNNTTDLAKSSSPSGELAYARNQRGVGNMTNYTSAFTGYRAAGGNTAFMVGEQGPEMFVPDRPGTIVPADETASAQQAPVNVNFSINAVDAAGIEELLMTQQGNIIGMIRTAANAHGESFLETVDDRALTMEK